MAWIFSLEAKFKNKITADSFANKYHGQTFIFDSNTMFDFQVCRMSAQSYQSGANEWWAGIVPSGVTDSGIGDVDEAHKADQFCNVIYGMLRNEKYFDYAIADVEVETFLSTKELEKGLTEPTEELYVWDGLVISNELYKIYSDSHPSEESPFVKFSHTHVWIPKKSFLTEKTYWKRP